MELIEFIKASLAEDLGDGDHTSQSTIPSDQLGKAHLLVKEDGIISGLNVAQEIFKVVDQELIIAFFAQDGDEIRKGDFLFNVEGKVQSILIAERLVLNCMQRMSGIATTAKKYVDAISGTNAKILDTRKTTPLLRFLEKEAVRTGGAHNHRFGLYDMILIKDNHVDSAGGIQPALEKAKLYLEKKNISIPIEIETRNLDEVEEAVTSGIPNRIMFDNFEPNLIQEALKIVDGKMESEASGGINLSNVRSYALTGVNYISIGALTHSVKSLDLSLKIVK
ncbi:MAG: carboxylating nicotinate-nucleotide diphosphorylase [Bacteroidetes bacterium]|nr:carboxylating nicotinate-nucleotide diphosphorylase [Bacteroidota bacterium]